jgi:uncharacterized membrane protein
MNQDAVETIALSDDRLQSLKNVTTAVYALQTASFLVGITFLVALIINYVKRADVQGTFLESHFTWQIRTFWYALLWGIVGFVTLFIVVGYFVLLANTVWIIYRIVKGWLRLADNRRV